MGSSSSKITPRDQAILDLKVQRDRLDDYRTKLQLVMDKETQVARQCLAKGDEARARLALRKKRFQAGLLTKTEGQMEQVYQMIHSVEFMSMQQGVFESLAQGNAALGQLNREMPIDDVERLMDETAEGVAYQQEVEELLAGVSTPEMDAEAEEELAALTSTPERMEQSLPDVPAGEV
ncbi:Snf7 family, partial [Piptocephalis cylindrospora]